VKLYVLRKVTALTLASVTVIAIAACGDDDKSSSATAAASTTQASGSAKGTLTTEQKGGLIQGVMPIASTYIAQNIKGMKDEAQKLGLTNLQISQSNGDPKKMVADVQDARTKGAKAIILNPVNSEAATPAIKAAADAGICSVVMYSNVENAGTNEVAPGMKAFVGWDEDFAARAVAGAMAEKMGGKGNVVMIQGLTANKGAQIREASSKALWKEKYPDIKVLAVQPADFDPAKARTVMQNFIQRFGDKINGVLVADDGMGAAAAEVIAKSDLAGKVVLGSFGGQKDYIQDIKDGKAYATIPFVPVFDGQKAVELAAQCMAGDKAPVAFNAPKFPELQPFKDAGYVVTGDNVAQFTPQW
jgi:ribose transport system substrate-binding protein